MSRNRPNKAYIAELGLFFIFSECFEKHKEKSKKHIDILAKHKYNEHTII